ncbi:MAG: universal stress protein [Desulfovermiculus sp.]
MYTRIVISVDHSQSSSHALEQALALSASAQSEVILVCVIPAYEGDLRLMGDSSILKSMGQPYMQALDQAGEQAAKHKVAFKKVLRSGEPGEQILTVAEEEKADLIVIGKKVSAVMDLIPIGSVSAKVLKLSETDVLVVPQGKELRMETLLIAYDGSKYARKAAEKGCELAVSYGAKVVLATLYEMSMEGYMFSPNVAQQLHAATLKKQDPILHIFKEQGVREYEQFVDHADPIYRGLSELAQRKAAGLAVLGSRGAGNISKILLGSVAARFISSGVCPTLVVKK